MGMNNQTTCRYPGSYNIMPPTILIFRISFYSSWQAQGTCLQDFQENRSSGLSSKGVSQSSDVTFDTEASNEACIKKPKHLTLKRRIGAWFVLPKARDLLRLKLHSPENHVTASVSGSNEANHSAVSFTLYYIIMRLHCFILYWGQMNLANEITV